MPSHEEHLIACHPERSTSVSKANRRAQSKDPYVEAVPFGRVRAFSPCSGQFETNSPKFPVKIANQSFDYARSFQRRSIQDENVTRYRN